MNTSLSVSDKTLPDLGSTEFGSYVGPIDDEATANCYREVKVENCLVGTTVKEDGFMGLEHSVAVGEMEDITKNSDDNESNSNKSESREKIERHKNNISSKKDTEALEENDNSMTNDTIKIEPLHDIDQVNDDTESYETENTKSSSDNDSDATIEEEYDLDSEEEWTSSTKKLQNNKRKGNKMVSTKKTLTKINSPSVKKEFQCSICMKILMSKRALGAHQNLHTGKFSCEKCGKFCKSELSLQTHAKVHEGFVGKEVCNVCDKAFYDKSSLNKHTLSVHMGIKHHKCELCGLEFYARKTYDEHMRVHTGERPFKCDQCPKTYKRIADLNHHMRLHKGEFSHTCEFCGDGFRRTSELKRHMSTKHRDDSKTPDPEKTKQRFPCEYCGVGFDSPTRLRAHSSKHIESLKPKDVREKEVEVMATDTQKLVDKIVQGLEPEHSGLKSSLQSYAASSDHVQNLSQSDEMRIRENVFGFSSFGISPSTAEHQIPSMSSGKEKSSEVVSDIKPFTEFYNTPNNKVEDKIQGHSVEQTSKLRNNGGNSDSNATAADFNLTSKVGNSYSQIEDELGAIKIEIERDEVNDFYSKDTGFDDGDAFDRGSDTEIDDYNYTMNDTEKVVPAESEKMTTATNKKSKSKKFPPKEGRKRKRKSKPTKRVKKIVIEVKSEQIESDDIKTENNVDEMTESISSEKKSKGRRKKTKTHTGEEENSSSQSKPSQFICEECGKVFTWRESFKCHQKLHAGMYKCKICSKTFGKKSSLAIHMANHEGKLTKKAACNVCDKLFYDASSVTKHVKNVHMNYRPYPCTECDRKFSEKKTLVEHMRVHTGERPFKCEQCGQSFKRNTELNFHMKKHTGETSITCPECGEGFRRQSELKTHNIMKHMAERPFCCSICGKGFMNNNILQEHFVTHSAHKDFECDKCGKGFHSVNRLKRHKKIKSDCRVRPEKVDGIYVCRFCFEDFLTSDDLNAHHAEAHDLPGKMSLFTCQVCFKVFKRMQALKRHLKIHSQTRDYKCEVCGAAFIQKHHLTQHERTHSGEKPYECNICSKRFAQAATLYSHIKHH